MAPVRPACPTRLCCGWQPKSRRGGWRWTGPPRGSILCLVRRTCITRYEELSSRPFRRRATGSVFQLRTRTKPSTSTGQRVNTCSRRRDRRTRTGTRSSTQRSAKSTSWLRHAWCCRACWATALSHDARLGFRWGRRPETLVDIGEPKGTCSVLRVDFWLVESRARRCR